jgi:hypothetical protein
MTGYDQGLPDSLITPSRCMFLGISYTSRVLLGEPLWGLANQLDISCINTVVYSVRPSVVIAFHSKDVSILVEELFYFRYLVSLRFGVAATIMSYIFRVVSGTCGCSTLGAVGGDSLPRVSCTWLPEHGGHPSRYICCLQLESLIEGLT